MFWFKKKEHIIDCFTTDPYALEYCKLTPAVRHYPEWFKRLPGMVDVNNQLIPSIFNSFINPQFLTHNQYYIRF